MATTRADTDPLASSTYAVVARRLLPLLGLATSSPTSTASTSAFAALR